MYILWCGNIVNFLGYIKVIRYYSLTLQSSVHIFMYHTLCLQNDSCCKHYG
jgi:hypothetical protein